jgi:tetratricopeptide (TPR) repeat protein
MEEIDMRNRWMHTVVLLIISFLVLPRMDAIAQEQTVAERVQALLKEGKYAEARPIIEKELQKDTLLSKNQKANLLFWLSFSLIELEEYRNSINASHALIALVPNNPLIWGNVGWAYYLDGDVDSAIIATDRALLLDDTQAFLWGNMGLYRLATRDIEGMQKAYAEVPKYAEDVETWQATLTDYEKYCSDPAREGCEKANQVLKKGWMNLLRRWYVEGDAVKGAELVRTYPDEYRRLHSLLSEQVEGTEGEERESQSALLKRLAEDLK